MKQTKKKEKRKKKKKGEKIDSAFLRPPTNRSIYIAYTCTVRETREKISKHFDRLRRRIHARYVYSLRSKEKRNGIIRLYARFTTIAHL